jgi:protein TonB
MKRKRTFTIFHGLVASIAVHAAIGLPFVMSVLAAPPEDPPLLIELQSTSDSQDMAEVKQSEVDQKKGDRQEPTPQTLAKETPPVQTAPSEEPQVEGPAADEPFHDPPPPTPTPTPPSPPIETPPPTPQSKPAPDDTNVNAAKQYVPPTRAAPQMTDSEYGALLTKKIRENLVYPDEAKRARLQGVTTVSFVILSDGVVQPGTLQIAKSSGQPALDAGALNTIRASAPFPPPPREMAVKIGVRFGDKS